MYKVFLSVVICLLVTVNSFSLIPLDERVSNDFECQKKNWTKNVWSVIDFDQKINEPLFFELNNSVLGLDEYSGRITTEMLNKEMVSAKLNLWTIMFYHILKGQLTIYCPTEPDWIDRADDGFLKYPFTSDNFGQGMNGSFFTDSVFKGNIKFYQLLGFDLVGIPEAMMSYEYPGEDSIDYNGDVVYHPFPFNWYQDKDIIKFKIKESWHINKNGEVMNKTITSIAPIVYQRDQEGSIYGEKELFWIDFKELKPILKSYYLLLDRYKRERVISYLEFFNQREFYASIFKEDKFQIKAAE